MMTDKEHRYDEAPRDSESMTDEYEGLVSGYRRSAILKKPRRAAFLMPVILLASLTLNILQLVYVATQDPQHVSLYAKLPENELIIPFHYETEYSSDEYSDEEKDDLWNEIDVSEGFIAMTHEESDALGLPRSKTFPWDLNKGMYVSHGHHALHCTVLLHAYTYDSHRGRTPFVSYHHVQHCLDLLRQDIICHADDFMDFTADHGDEFLTGDNQPRYCRDWNKLSAFVKERSSCYKTVNITRAGEDHGVAHQLERYTYCPKGSPYEEVIKAWRDLDRPNPGNLANGAWATQNEEDLKADAEAVAKHNKEILEDLV